jgi:hypothetical protein
MDTEKRWEIIALRKRADAELFERKFLDYRNKMLDILDHLEDRNELPDLQNELKKFMQDEQGDVEFTA